MSFRPFDQPDLLGRLCPYLAGWVRSPTAGSEHPSSQNLGLGDWLLSGNCYGRFGSLRDRPLVEFVAGKRSVKFRFL